jgi:hypothetical protein
MLRPEDLIGRLRRLGLHANGLEEENRLLQAELSALHEARRDNGETFTVRQWDPAGVVLVNTIASHQNLHVGPHSGNS